MQELHRRPEESPAIISPAPAQARRSAAHIAKTQRISIAQAHHHQGVVGSTEDHEISDASKIGMRACYTEIPRALRVFPIIPVNPCPALPVATQAITVLFVCSRTRTSTGSDRNSDAVSQQAEAALQSA